jgi:hypothetical protein
VTHETGAEIIIQVLLLVTGDQQSVSDCLNPQIESVRIKKFFA